MKPKQKSKSKRSASSRSLRDVVRPEVMWAIHGGCGFYIGTWLTRRWAISDHTKTKGKSWKDCVKDGDRAIKVRLLPV